MPRNNLTGVYSKPAGTTATTGNVIDPTAWNNLTTDLGNEITASLPVAGEAGMTGQFKAADGTTSGPGISFGSEVNTGIYRKSAGTVAMAIGGVDAMIVNSSQITLAGLAIVNGADAGAISYFARSTAPTGYIKANGAAVSRTTYATLFAAIGTTWGAGDGSTTFNVPDLRGYFPRGFDDGRGVDSGRTFATTQADAFASHNHGVNDPTHNHGVSDPGHAHSIPSNVSNTFGSGFGLSGSGNVGIGIENTNPNTTGVTIVGNPTGITIQAAGGTETRPKNIALLACIKY